MKKLIWIFGIPGCGKSTLISDILDNNNNIKDILGIEGQVDFADISFEDKNFLNSYFDFDKRVKDIFSYLSYYDEDNILLVGNNYDINILGRVADNYPDAFKEIIFLNPSDQDLLYERMKESKWFKSDDNNIYKYPRVWIGVAVNHLRKELISAEKYGYKFIEIDNNDGYVIIDKFSNCKKKN